MSAEDFNAKMMASGDFTPAHIVRLVEYWQRCHDLVVDGYAGKNTLASIIPDTAIEKFYPLRLLEDGRKPVITSGFHTENSSRSGHDGVDFFYHWLDSDPGVFAGTGGAIKVNGKRRWWYPDGALAYAAASGVVSHANMQRKGFRVWIDHGNGERSGYFHGEEGLVKVGDPVIGGVTPVIVVGDNPSGGYKKHLHFEVSPVDKYAPMNPRKWLEGAGYSDFVESADFPSP